MTDTAPSTDSLYPTVPEDPLGLVTGGPDGLPDIEDPRIWRILEMAADEETHYTVNELASVVRLSASRLSRVFKEETGFNLGDLLTRKRLHRAARMLVDTEEPIKCIAYRVGYNHPSSFVRAFRSQFSESPKTFRRRMLLSALSNELGSSASQSRTAPN